MTAGVAPRILTPSDAADTAATLAACAREGAAVVVIGGSTLQSLGNAPRRCDVALHTHNLRGIRDYDPRDMTAGIEAGTTLAEIARVLGEHGQWIPFDAPLPARATAGGTLAAGWAGPRRAAYGRPRDLVIGSTIALTDGTLARAGGMVVKNVTGYDMSKLYVGSLGTLGVIVRANFKALPRPAARRLAIAPVAGELRDRTLAAIGALAIEPAAALVVDGFARAAAYPGATLRLVLLFEGSEAVVERGTRDARSALGKAGVAETLLHDGDAAERGFAEVIDAYIDAPGERTLTYRSTGLPSTAWTRTRAAAALAREHGLHAESIADLRTGDAILRFSARTIASFSEKIAVFDAGVRHAFERVTVLAGGAALRASIDAWGNEPSTIATMRAIKAHFDPAGSSHLAGMSARSNALLHDVRIVVTTVLRSPDRFVRLIRLGPRGLVSMARFLIGVVPRASRALEAIRERANAIPAAALREQALASIDGKAFHVQGGCILATFLPAADAARYVRIVASLETIYDYLDNLCDRLPGVSQAAFATLHGALLDALDDRRTPGPYYAHGPAGDDGGYLISLVADVRAELATVRHYAEVRDALAQIAGYYAQLQTLKHGDAALREAVCSAWYAEHAESFPGLYWWEFAAACGSSLPVFALIYIALQPRIDARAIDSTVAAYFPNVSAVHILLDYFIDQAEDLEHRELNFVACYPSSAVAVERVGRLVRATSERLRALAHGEWHEFVLRAMCLFYLTHPKVYEQRLDRESAAVLAAL